MSFFEVFHIFDPLAIIFAIEIYTFLESARQGVADEPIKTPKKHNISLKRNLSEVKAIAIKSTFSDHTERNAL